MENSYCFSYAACENVITDFGMTNVAPGVNAKESSGHNGRDGMLDVLDVKLLQDACSKESVATLDGIRDCTAFCQHNLHLETAVNPKSWINLHGCFRVLDHRPNDDDVLRFLWASEMDGYRHLYVIEANLAKESRDAYDSRLVHRVTGPGEYVVDDVVEVDADNNDVYYMGRSPGGWLGRRLYRASLDGSGEGGGRRRRA